MSDQGEEGQIPEPPGLGGRGELPPRPTLRESVRRGLFVRLPTEGGAEEGLAGAQQSAEEQSGQGLADQYPEQVADPYPGWRQAADGSWEAVDPEAYNYAESAEPAAPEAYPEIDQSANYASVAGGEPFSHEEAGAEVPAWPIDPEREVQEAAAEAVVPVTPQSPEIVSGVMPEAEPEAPAEAAAEAAVEAPAYEVPQMPQPPVVAEPVAEVVPEPVAEVVPEPEAAAEVATEPEVPAVAETPSETTPAVEDPVAGTGLYIPSDVELLEDDMRVYGEKENVPPRFAGSGLGEPYFIEFDDLSETLSGLRRLLPKGTRLTYNYDYERAWVRTSADIDLASFAERLKEPAEKSDKASS
jgi:hypothetical protein